MGGSPSKPKNQKAPPQAQPIDYAALMAQSSEAASKQYKEQLAAQIDAYPKLERMQLGTLDNVATKLSAEDGTLYENRYIPGVTTGEGKDKKTTEGRWKKIALGKSAPNLYTARANEQLLGATDQVDKIGRIGDYTEQLGYTAAEDLQGTAIEKELQRQAEGDLALGRSLSPEEARAATQQARAGMSARGLGAGTGALAAEVLNRDAYATAREAARRNFAGQTNQMLVSNRQNRIGQIGNILGQSVNTRMNQANLGVSLSQANIAADPTMRAMNPALGMGSGTLGQSGQMIGNTYNNATQMAGNVAGVNASMLDSRWNTVQNNNASLQSAYLGAKASSDAANMGLQGSAMGASAVIGAAAAACWVARAAFGTSTSRWRLYRRVMLRGASDRTIRLYCQHGPSIATRITTPVRRFIARCLLRSLEIAWK